MTHTPFRRFLQRLSRSLSEGQLRLSQKFCQLGLTSLLFSISLLSVWLSTALPSAAHWEDLTTAKITVQATSAQISLIYPGELTAFADDDGNSRLSDAEIANNRAALQTFFQDRIRLKNDRDRTASLTVQSRGESFAATGTITGTIAPKTHTTLLLNYTWPEPFQTLTIDYHLFVPDTPKASCVATISQAGQLANHVFTPRKTTLVLSPEGIAESMAENAASILSGKWLLSLAGAFLWGALHSMSPGHGKTLVGAYLIGERATPLHAVFLAMTTTITHTLGVFALGLVTLFAARYILPEQLYPWLSLVSGSMVVVIGLNLLWQRWRRWQSPSEEGVQPMAAAGVTHDHHHHDHHHHHHDHHNGLDHHHDHGHHHSPDGHHTHSHLPAAVGEKVTWRSLLLLGLSAGLVPCPAALVLLLGAIAIGNPFSGIVLVLVFSLGLSVVLTALGLILVYAKQMFKQLPAPKRTIVEWLPTASACGIVIIGSGIFARSLLQIL